MVNTYTLNPGQKPKNSTRCACPFDRASLGYSRVLEPSFQSVGPRNPLLSQVFFFPAGIVVTHRPTNSLIYYSERNASSPMKIDTLQFVHTVLIHHPPEVAHEHIAALLPSLLSAVSDPFYKITSEALLVLQQLVNVFD